MAKDSNLNNLVNDIIKNIKDKNKVWVETVSFQRDVEKLNQTVENVKTTVS